MAMNMRDAEACPKGRTPLVLHIGHIFRLDTAVTGTPCRLCSLNLFQSAAFLVLRPQYVLHPPPDEYVIINSEAALYVTGVVRKSRVASGLVLRSPPRRRGDIQHFPAHEFARCYLVGLDQSHV